MTYAVPPSRREAIVRQLRDEIVTGELAPGTVLKDAELATRLGVSITPIREAVAQLTSEGLVDLAPNRVRRVSVITRKNALDLIDVMGVLASAGVEWGLPHLTDTEFARMRARLADSEAALERGDTTAASAAGADVSTIMISASGNLELQSHVDLTVTRTVRLLALAADDDLWQIWRDGYRDVIALLEQDRRNDAVARYRRIFDTARTRIADMPFTD
ncbi:GntR family transcriptional regulator [Pseudonocardia sp. KRD291]|uniref:GntR family transcriptional regulator n=1 Tax=Pseudonocardia sp. KRD291 TaxID=2792007 RepID=UPI001C49FE21|nr:GntR family transcriptional regulator [Pseudonocardia sp. KRD291]MBW0102059.1 GntR family transcriptional regulator [Pseudonocardia sp. KRD291]